MIGKAYLIFPENWFRAKADPQISCELIARKDLAEKILNEKIRGFKIKEIQSEHLIIPDTGFISAEIFQTRHKKLRKIADENGYMYYSMTIPREEFCEHLYPKIIQAAKHEAVKNKILELNN
ncbi:hypothetical protein CL684_02900 [Candidatus Campbellbacteria bacterium]|nr:hypothetical protein [Candidatus Campbellbacteria bacterium]|tara:strand:+ start:568 stop:933 length:366 start_codon:yes stop_codon:yes gene_type:complete